MEYAVTLRVEQPDEALLDAFEDAIDRLPEGAMVGSVDAGHAALIFTVEAPQVLDASARACYLLARAGVPTPDNARLRVERQGDLANIGADTIRNYQEPQ